MKLRLMYIASDVLNVVFAINGTILDAYRHQDLLG
jgi:hypothetical protein